MILSKAIFRNIKMNINLTERNYAKQRHPFTRTWETLFQDVKDSLYMSKRPIFPEHADVVVVGGGFIGASTAYWLKNRAGDGLSVVVLDKDPTVSILWLITTVRLLYHLLDLSLAKFSPHTWLFCLSSSSICLVLGI